jgi:hypothetical protein
MATQRQIDSNSQNATRSTGPKTDRGKARSRVNATKHGLAAELPSIEDGQSAEFLDRREKWSAEYAPVGETGGWALDRAVAASIRIERCEQAFDEVIEEAQERARFAWDQDQAVEAELIAARLDKEPALASRRLETTRSGVSILIELWFRLVEALAADGGWSESDASKALDLLGVDADLRSGRTPIDAPEGADLSAFREEIALDEIARLEALRANALDELDELARRQAMNGNNAMFSKPAKLILRYEREAWKRYRESIKEVRNPAEASAPVESPSIPIIVSAKPSPQPAPTFVQDRQSLLAGAAAILAEMGIAPGSVPLDDEAVEGFLKDLENRRDGIDQATPERTRIDGVLQPTQA